MNRRSFLKWANLAGLAAGLPLLLRSAPLRTTRNLARRSARRRRRPHRPETILLKDYRPKSIYKIPVTEIAKAKFPIIDMHSHPYAKTAQEIEQWVGTWTRSESRRR